MAGFAQQNDTLVAKASKQSPEGWVVARGQRFGLLGDQLRQIRLPWAAAGPGDVWTIAGFGPAALPNQRYEPHRPQIFLFKRGLAGARDLQQVLTAFLVPHRDEQAPADGELVFER